MNLEERGQSALKLGLWTDCNFIVGEEKKEMSACKVLLSLASPVFDDMLHDASGSEIVVPDVNPKVFEKLLVFAYTHKIQVKNVEEGLQLMAAGHKYKMPDLIQSCTPFLKSNLKTDDIKQLCEMLDIAELYDIAELREIAMKTIKSRTLALLESPEFLNLSVRSLQTILRRGHLNVNSEMDLINATLQWTKTSVREENHLRQTLEEKNLLKHLRFLSLSDRELETCLDLGVLGKQDIDALRCHTHSLHDMPLPDFLCPISTTRKMTPGIPNRIRMASSVCVIKSGQKREETFEIGSLKPFLLESVTLAAQICCDLLASDSYEEDLDVKVLRLPQTTDGAANGQKPQFTFGQGFNSFPAPDNPPKKLFCQQSAASFTFAPAQTNKEEVMYVASFIGMVKYRDELMIPLKCHEQVRILSSGDRFKVEVTYNKAGTYPMYSFCNNSLHITCQEASGNIVQIN